MRLTVLVWEPEAGAQTAAQGEGLYQAETTRDLAVQGPAKTLEVLKAQRAPSGPGIVVSLCLPVYSCPLVVRLH